MILNNTTKVFLVIWLLIGVVVFANIVTYDKHKVITSDLTDESLRYWEFEYVSGIKHPDFPFLVLVYFVSMIMICILLQGEPNDKRKES